MAKSIYLPFWVSLGTIVFCMLPIQAIDEPPEYSESRSRFPYREIHDAEPSSASDPIPDEAQLPGSASVSHRPHIDGSRPISDSDSDSDGAAAIITESPKTSSVVVHFIFGVLRVFHSPTLTFCISMFYLKSVAMASEGLIFQYASERFGWALRETTWLRVALASSATFVTLVAGPLASTIAFAVRRGGGGGGDGVAVVHKLDLNVTRISLCTLAVFMFSAWCSKFGLEFLLCMCTNNFKSFPVLLSATLLFSPAKKNLRKTIIRRRPSC